MTGPPRLEKSIREYFAPALRADGFSGTGRTFRRVVGDFIQVVNVQGSIYGGQFAVNLALHPLCIPDVRGQDPDPKKITEPLCEFRRRLSEFGADQWWKHDGTTKSMDEAVKAAAAIYCSRGRPLLEHFGSSVSPLHLVTAEAFAKGHYNFHGFGSTKARMALALARFLKARGNPEEARKFAAIGLTSIDNGATWFRKEFESLVEGG